MMDHFGSICSIYTTCGLVSQYRLWYLLIYNKSMFWFFGLIILLFEFIVFDYSLFIWYRDIKNSFPKMTQPSFSVYSLYSKNISPSYPIVPLYYIPIVFRGDFLDRSFRSGICAAWRSGFLDAPDTDGSMVSPRFFQRFPWCLIVFNDV